MGIHYNEDRRQKHSMRRSVCVCVLAGLSLPTLLAASPATEQSRVAKVEASTNLNDQSSKKVKIIGVVTDSKTGEPVIGAAIRLKGSTTGALTDIEGNFEIQANPGDVLLISSMGYTPKEVRVGKTNILSITLTEDAKVLDQVVVTAFGTGQKKETITGSIQTVRPMELKVPAANLSTAFAGRLAGHLLPA